MNSTINPELAQPTTTQAFAQSDRNPAIGTFGGADAGAQISVPAASMSRVTPAGAAVSPNAGLVDYDTGDSDDAGQDEAEREG